MNNELTLWWCLTCHASGTLALGGIDVYGGVEVLEQEHNEDFVAKLQSCRFDIANVRVQRIEAPLVSMVRR